jgi:cardiolipin synthase
MKRFSKKEIFSIPNLMGYFRILLIPVFCYLYITAETNICMQRWLFCSPA